MKILSIVFLLFSILCNSQQNRNDKKYLDPEAISQKYQNIKDQYDALVEQNKQNLINEDGVYFNKASYEQEKQKKNGEWIDPMHSKSKLVLKEGDQEFFIKDEGQGIQIYATRKGNLIEEASIIKKDNKVHRVTNFPEGIDASYDFDNDKIFLYYFILDKYDPKKRDIMLYQEFVNNQLVLEKNYKKDFKSSQEQMLKGLPDNFYHSALNYLIKESKERPEKGEMDKSASEIEKEIKERLQLIKNRLKTAIETKNDVYKKIRVYKTYNENNAPTYHLFIPENPTTTRVIWMINMDGKTNKIISVERETPIY